MMYWSDRSPEAVLTRARNLERPHHAQAQRIHERPSAVRAKLTKAGAAPTLVLQEQTKEMSRMHLLLNMDWSTGSDNVLLLTIDGWR